MATAPAHANSPMMEMNTTPLIDVLLVLLVMLILTIPVATHSLQIDVGGKSTGVVVHSVSNRLVLTNDEKIEWNGQVVTKGQLATLLKRSAAMPTEPELHSNLNPVPDTASPHGLRA